ncbi:MAG: DUF4331 domain-containing protein [Betaproteobacteria bacterium]
MKSRSSLTRICVALACASAALGAGSSALASSHREAPMISKMPAVDNTDLYAFRSYEPGRDGYVVILANFIPLQDAYAGPNFYNMDPDALYEIHIDNNGDGKEDLTYSFKFKNTVRGLALDVGGRSVSVPLVNIGQITTGSQPTMNVIQSYTINQIRGPKRDSASTVGAVVPILGGTAIEKPQDNIGNKSIPNYANYAGMHIRGVTIPGCTPPAGTFPRVFVGQRKEGFGVNLGEIFDLVNIATPKVIGSRSGSGNATAYKNVTTIALELPISCITTAADPVIGVFSTVSLPPNRIGSTSTAAYTQVSRLGMPLVNELVIGLPDKDKFNASEPKDDGQFANYVTNPTLPALLGLLYADAGVAAPNTYPRTDLVAVFLTGVAGVNQPKNVVASEMLRLNTALPVTPKGSQNSLGAAACFVNGALVLSNAGCDPAGFPNGRRPGDDVVDIELRVAMGYLLPPGAGKPASASLPYTDGVLVDDSMFDNVFPFLWPPLPGSPNGKNGIDPTGTDPYKSRRISAE